MPAVNREGKTTVEVSGKIDVELYEEWKLYFPQYGASTWMIETAMRELLKQVRGDLDASELMARAIEEYLQERRNTA